MDLVWVNKWETGHCCSRIFSDNLYRYVSHGHFNIYPVQISIYIVRAQEEAWIYPYLNKKYYINDSSVYELIKTSFGNVHNENKASHRVTHLSQHCAMFPYPFCQCSCINTCGHSQRNPQLEFTRLNSFWFLDRAKTITKVSYIWLQTDLFYLHTIYGRYAHFFQPLL